MLKWAWLTLSVLYALFHTKTLNFSIHIYQFFSSLNAAIVYFEKVIRVVRRSGLCRNDLIEVVEVALAQWVMDTQQRGASSLVQWLKLMGTYGAAAPLNPWSIALILRSFIWDFVLINKRCLLLTMGSGWGKKNPPRKRREPCFVVEDKHCCEQFRLWKTWGGNDSFGCCLCVIFFTGCLF